MGDLNSTKMPTDNEEWFKRHIIDQLSDLRRTQEENSRRQESMHASNITKIEAFAKDNAAAISVLANNVTVHIAEDNKNFKDIAEKLADVPLMRKILYTAVGLILISVLGALLALVVNSVKPQPSVPAVPSQTK